ncbi:MAG: hypothetical protein KBE09_00380 [Candidatus Pacebacteria bacterium]|nr:hypothetical protein [Candidatus Paceibacterota bacterium]
MFLPEKSVTTLLVVIFLALSVPLIVFCFSTQAPRTSLEPAYATRSVPERLAHWQARIREVGGEQAYSELAEVISTYAPHYQHDEVHLFGDALYRVHSISGVSVCDGRFGYACFHAFMIRALIESGASEAQQLYNVCLDTLGESSRECEHGIGHGLLALLKEEATDADLQKALATCETLQPPSHPISGCAGGVFMEFLVKSMASGSIEPREFTDARALDPCSTLTNSPHLASCFYWLPVWWMLATPERAQDPLIAEKMGAWCREAPTEEATKSCVKGVANRMQLLTNEQPALTYERCAAVTKDPELRYVCQTHAARRFTYYFPLNEALVACMGLPQSKELECRTQATNDSQLILKDRAQPEHGQ